MNSLGPNVDFLLFDVPANPARLPPFNIPFQNVEIQVIGNGIIFTKAKTATPGRSPLVGFRAGDGDALPLRYHEYCCLQVMLLDPSQPTQLYIEPTNVPL